MRQRRYTFMMDTVSIGNDANFVIIDAQNYYEALNYNKPVLASYRKGVQIAKTIPESKSVAF